MSGAAENDHAAERGGDHAQGTARDRGFTISYIHTHRLTSSLLAYCKTMHVCAQQAVSESWAQTLQKPWAQEVKESQQGTKVKHLTLSSGKNIFSKFVWLSFNCSFHVWCSKEKSDGGEQSADKKKKEEKEEERVEDVSIMSLCVHLRVCVWQLCSSLPYW